MVKFVILNLLAVSLIFSLGATAHVSAASKQSGTFAQGFQSSDKSIESGALVSLIPKSPKNVELATDKTAEWLIGVVDASPLLTISENKKEVQVVINGTAEALVSDINGKIKAGDKISPSPIAGVGMRATSNSQIVGSAASNQTGGKKVTITDKDGAKHAVSISRVTLQVGVSRYQSPGSDLLPPFLDKLARNIAGRQVSVIRILIATVLLVLGFAAVLTIVFSSIRSTIISTGRNPLASKDIRRSLYQVLSVALIVAVVTGVTSYLIVKL